MDVALHRCGVTFVLDRSGVTGDDGASHNGMWDMSILQVVPGLRLAAPRDATRLRELLREAVAGRRRPDRRALPEGPAQRRPRARRPRRRLRRARPQRRQGRADRRRRLDGRDVGRGRRAAGGPGHRRHRRRPALGQAGRPGAASTWPASTGWWSASRTTASSAAAARCCCRPSTRRGVDTPVRLHGIPQEFLDHAKRGVILERIGLTAQTLARSIVEDVTALDAGRVAAAGRVAPALFGWRHGLRRRRACAPASRPSATGPPTSTGPAARRCPRQVARRGRRDDDLAASPTAARSTAAERRAEEVVLGARAAVADLLGCDAGGRGLRPLDDPADLRPRPRAGQDAGGPATRWW